jgi:hypothetical protein
MARTMIQPTNGHSAQDARKRAAILARMDKREDRETRDMLSRLAGTDTASLRAELAR